MSARSFIWKWSWRTVRNEWRQYVVVLVMLTLGVAASVAGVLAVHNMTEPPQSEFGNAGVAVDSPDSVALAHALNESGFSYGLVQRATLERDGQVGDINLRAADPENAITEPLFALRNGRWPASSTEIAITDQALADQPPIGTSIQLDGRTVEIVGVVENPTQLSDEFVFALAPAVFPSAQAPRAQTFLVDASADEVRHRLNVAFNSSSSDGTSLRTGATILVNVIVAFGMLEIALLVGSAFAVIARRRTRQYGLLAAAGATPRIVRSAAASSGAIIGVIGTMLGLFLGFFVARGIASAMETAVDHRINFEVPFVALLPSLVFGVLVATLGARRPAKALSRQPIASLLAAARPKPEPVGSAALFGVVLAVVGVVLLATGFADENGTFAVIGTVLAPIGLLLIAPLLVKLVGQLAAHLPLAERLASRFLSRYNRRSAAMVAAIALALAIPVGIAVASTSIDQRAEGRPPNLADHQLVLWAPDVDPQRSAVPATIDEVALESAMRSLAEAAPELRFAPLKVAIPEPNNGFNEDGVDYAHAIVAGQRTNGDLCNFCSVDTIGFDDGEEYIATQAVLATPELLAALGLDQNTLGTGGISAIASEPGLSVVTPGVLAGPEEIAVSDAWPRAGSLPKLVFSPELAKGSTLTTIGWLAVGDGSLTDETMAAISQVAVSGASLELPSPTPSRSTLRILGLLIGLGVALGITVSAVMLLTAEVARDSALLAAQGASPRTGRRMSAAMAGLLALVGAMLGVLIGYLPLAPMLSSKVDEFPFVIPWSALLAALVVFPFLAAAMGWSLSKRSADGLDLRDFA